MSSPLASMYRPGTTVLHRLPVGAKVLGLSAFSVAVVAIHSPLAAPLFWLLALALALVGRVPLRVLARASRPVLVIAVVAGLLQGWWYGPERAVETCLDLLAMGMAATVVSATTSMNSMLDALVRWLGPLRRIGVDPDRVSLAFALAIGALPGTLAVARETHDAARARGLERSVRANVTPFVTRVVARGLATGDALHARGLGD